MQSGKLNYAYRVSAARLAILRLRFRRRWQRQFQSPPSPLHARVLRGLAAMAILGVMAGSAWLGYQAGQQGQAIPLMLTDTRSATANRPHAGQRTYAPPATVYAPTPGPVAAVAAVIPVASEPDRAERQAKAARLAELVNLRKTVGQLQAQMQALEQETTGLEVELLDQQLAFAKAEEQWKEELVEKRVVYNFTNIPLGGYVSEERIRSDAEQPEVAAIENDVNDQLESIDDSADPYEQYQDIDEPVERWNDDAYLAAVLEKHSTDANFNDAMQDEGATDQAGRGPAGRFSSFVSAPSSDFFTENSARQEVFFGPAEDQFNDWNER